MQDSELVQSFLTESQEMLDDAEPKLIELQQKAEEAGGVNQEVINSIFRLFHSIKGSAGFLQFTNITAVTHEAETLLDLIRKGKARITGSHIDILCRACDLIREILVTVGETLGDVGHEDRVKIMTEELSKAIEAGRSEASASAAPTTPPPPPAPVAAAGKDEEAMKADMIIGDDEPAPPPPSTPSEEIEIPVEAPSEKMVVTAEMLSMFVQDAEELLEIAEQALLKIEAAPLQSKDSVAEALRALHTLKGNSGFLNLNDVQKLSHRLETVLQNIRDEKVQANSGNVKLMLKIIDVLKKTVADVGKGGSGKLPGLLGLMDLLGEIIPAEAQKAAPAPAPVPAPTPIPAPAEPVKAPKPPPAPEPKKETPPKPVDEARAEPKAAEATAAGATVARRDVRVSVDKLDMLNNLVGELVIAEAMVTHSSDLQGLRLDNFERAAHQLSLITSELQDIAMSLRMIPLEATMRKMIRLVHDLSAKAGKKIDLQLLGTETQVDRTVAELISDPLVHMVRNSVDHGIEKPEDRRTARKPETGTVRIEAKHQAGEVWIVITDDGRGLSREKILAKAVERGLIKEGSAMRDDEIYNLIFEPGFSTAEKITDVSGRGVGMDVVRKNIEKIRGRVDIATQPGKGTTFTIHIPLTLAIIQGMLVRVGRERYIIQLLAIRESFRPDKSMLTTVVGRGEMISIRGELLPLFRLSRLFTSPDAIEDPTQAIVVVVEDGSNRVGLLVDDLLGQQQTVIKSLSDAFAHLPGLSGASIMSDGHVGLILDIGGIVKIATAQE